MTFITHMYLTAYVVPYVENAKLKERRKVMFELREMRPKVRRRATHPNTKLTPLRVAAILDRLSAGESVRSVAEAFRVTTRSIYMLRKGTRHALDLAAYRATREAKSDGN